jgi:hypothetical protein
MVRQVSRGVKVEYVEIECLLKVMLSRDSRGLTELIAAPVWSANDIRDLLVRVVISCSGSLVYPVRPQSKRGWGIGRESTVKI